ncbi:DUF1292 domain-containing protein [Alloiococcus sp. CFN-8]|uniref:DUF1292 domain-containing protein n=1 Tax=Alloiococcus sp. CFN-8 TaxID=3416081 RepID=UPI003CED7141
MTINSIMSFKNEDGKSVKYKILDELIVNKAGYLLMAPVEALNEVDVYKLKFDKHMNEQLLLVENENEITAVKKASHISF